MTIDTAADGLTPEENQRQIQRNADIDALVARNKNIPASVLRELGASQSDLINLDNIANHKLLRSCKFAIHLLRHPASLPEFANIPLREFTFLCDSLELPGRSLTATEFTIPGNFKIKTPYRREFNEITLSFYHNVKLPIYDYFTYWIDSASPNISRNSYFDDITIDLDLVQFDDAHSKYELVRLIRAYPLSVASLPCNWADDGFHKLQVTMFYEYIQSVNESTSSRIKDRADNTPLFDADLSEQIQQSNQKFVVDPNSFPIPTFNIK